MLQCERQGIDQARRPLQSIKEKRRRKDLFFESFALEHKENKGQTRMAGKLDYLKCQLQAERWTA